MCMFLLSLVTCVHKALLSAGCWERGEPSTSWSGAIGSSGWAHSLHLCLLTSAHVRGKGGKRQRILCCHSNTEACFPPPPPKSCLECGAFCSFLGLTGLCVHVASLWNPGKTPRPPPPPLPLPAHRRIDCSCSACLSCVSVLWGDHQPAGPGVFHPLPESSTPPSARWKEGYWELSPEVVRQETQSPLWLCVCLVVCLHPCKGRLKSASLSCSSRLLTRVDVR